MSSKVPIVKQVGWLSVLPQLAVLVVLIILAGLFGFNRPVPIGVILYLAIFYLLRFQVPKHHRRGISLFKKKAFSEAIQHFQKSYDFFKRNMWIDNYRYITLLSSSRVSYTEMALLNMAYCYSQIGKGQESLKFYKKSLDEFPDSEMAKAALKMFESAKNVTEQTCVRDGEDHAAPNT